MEATVTAVQTVLMARYSALLGRRVEVHYRNGEILMPVTGTLAADSGKSIFLEEHFQHQQQVKSFRWEIPYRAIVNLSESPAQAMLPTPSFIP
jgi:hypothetical protein